LYTEYRDKLKEMLLLSFVESLDKLGEQVLVTAVTNHRFLKDRDRA